MASNTNLPVLDLNAQEDSDEVEDLWRQDELSFEHEQDDGEGEELLETGPVDDEEGHIELDEVKEDEGIAQVISSSRSTNATREDPEEIPDAEEVPDANAERTMGDLTHPDRDAIIEDSEEELIHASVGPDMVRQWHERWDSNEDADLTWERRLRLWSERLRSIEYENLIFEPTSALSELKRYSWLGLGGRGQVGFECLRWLGGDLVARHREREEHEYECVVNEDNLIQKIEEKAGNDARIVGLLRNLEQRGEIASLLEDLRGCKPDELLRRLRDENEFGLIIPFMRLRYYSKEELCTIMQKLCRAELERRNEMDVRNSLRHFLSVIDRVRNGSSEMQVLVDKLDMAVDKYMRSKRIFAEALRRSVTQTQENGNEIVIVDPRRGADLTPLDEWFRRSRDDNEENSSLSLNLRSYLVEREQTWFRATWPLVRRFVFGFDESQDHAGDSEPDIFNLLDRNDPKFALEEGTSKDAYTHKLRQYCSKKERLIQQRDSATLGACLAAAQDPNAESREQGDGEAERVILVIGYQASARGARLASGRNAPVAVRCLSVSDESDDKITEVGARLDGLYTRIPDEQCEAARDKIYNSVLPVREERDSLVFYEFIPTGVHAAESAPLERVIAEPPQLPLPASRGQHDASAPLVPTASFHSPRSPSTPPPNAGAREGVAAKVVASVEGRDSHEVQSSQQQRQRQHANLRQFTHILLEMDSIPTEDGDVRSKEKSAYRSLEESCERRFLISLAQPGKVDVEGMRLPSLAVLPRSSVAPEQNNLSFRRYLMLLPATFLGYDNTPTETHELAGLLSPFAKTAYVETAETLTQVLSIIMQLRGATEAKEIVYEKLKSNQLILNCMSVTSLVSIAPRIFKEPVHRVWNTILTPHDSMSNEERAARDAALALITGRSMGAPATAVLATEDMWTHLNELLRKHTKFACEELDVEPSNFWSIADRLARRVEMSVSAFIFVRLTGRTNAGMLEKLLGVAAESRCVKLIFLFSKGLMALYNRLSADIRPRVFLHDLVAESAKDVSPVIAVERHSIYESLLRSVSHTLVESPDFARRTLMRINQKAREAEQWAAEIQSAFVSPSEHVRENVRVLVTEDAEALTETLRAPELPKFDFLNARDPRCIEKLRSLLSIEETDVEDKPTALVLLHAHLLVRDRLQVIAAHCIKCRKPLLLVVNAATRDLTSFSTTLIDGTTTFERVDVIHARTRLPAPDHGLFRVELGLRVLLGPHLFLSDDDRRDLKIFIAEDDPVNLPGFLSEFALRLSTQPPLLHRMLRTLDSNSEPKQDFSWDQAKTTREPTLLGDLVASVLWAYAEQAKKDLSGIVHYSDVATDPVMLLAPQALRIWTFIACLEGATSVAPKCALEARLNISRTDNPGEILCSTLGELSPQDAATSALQEVYFVDPGRGDTMTPLSDIIELTAIRGSDLHWNAVYHSWVRTPEVSTPVLLHLLQEAPSRLQLVLSLSKTRMSSLPLPRLVVDRLSRDLDALRSAVTETNQGEELSEVAEELRHRVAALAWSILKHQAIESNGTNAEGESQEFERLVHDFLRSDLQFDFKSESGEDRILEKRLIGVLLQVDEPVSALLQQPKIAEVVLGSRREDRALMQSIFERFEGLVMGAALLALCLHSSWREKVAESADVIHARVNPLVKWATGSTATSVWTRLERVRSMPNWQAQVSPAAMAEVVARGAASHRSDDSGEAFSRFVREHVLEAARSCGGLDAQQSYIEQLLQGITHQAQEIADWDRFNVCLRVCGLLRNETLAGVQVNKVLERMLAEAPASVFRFALQSVSRNQFAFEALAGVDQSFDLVASPVLLRLYVAHFAGFEGTDSIESMKARHLRFFPTQSAREALLSVVLTTASDGAQGEARASFRVLAYFAWAANPVYNLPSVLLPAGQQQWDEFCEVVRDNDLREACDATSEPLSLLATFALMPHTLSAETLNGLKARFVSDKRPVFRTDALVLAQRNSVDFPLYALRVELGRKLPQECVDHVFASLQEGGSESLKEPKEWNKRLAFPRVQEGFSVETVKHNVRLLIHLPSAMEQVYLKSQTSPKVHTGLALLTWFLQAGLDPEGLAGLIKLAGEEALGSARNSLEIIADGAAGAPGAEVFCPLPVVVDARFVDESGGNSDALFEKLSLSITAQQVQFVEENFPAQAGSVSRSTFAERTRQAQPADYPSIVLDLFAQVGSHIARVGSVEWAKIRLVGSFLIGLRVKTHLVETAFAGLAKGLDETQQGRNCLPEVFDGLFIILGLTPLTDGKTVQQMVAAFVSYNWNGPDTIFMSETCRKEIIWMSNNVFKGQDELDKVARDLAAKVETLKFKNVKRNAAASGTVSDLVGDKFISRLRKALVSSTLPLATRAAAEALHIYDDCLVGSILPVRKGPQPVDLQSNSDSHGAYEGAMQSQSALPLRVDDVAEPEHVLTAPSLMQQASQDIEDEQAALSIALSLQKAAEGAASRGPSLVSARTLLRIDCQPSYGTLEVAPGLHPVLRRPGEQDEEDAVRYVRHSPFSFDGDLGEGADIAHVFANNGETWDLFQGLPNNSTILGRGFYLRKTQQGTWVMLMATTRNAEQDSPELFLHTILSIHRLAAFHFHDEVLMVLGCLVQTAFAVGVPQAETPATVSEVLERVEALRDEEERITEDEVEVASEEAENPGEDEEEDNDDADDEDEDSEAEDKRGAGASTEAHAYTAYKDAELRFVTWMLDQLKEISKKASDHNVVPQVAPRLARASQELQKQLSKALAVIMSTTDHEARSQLYFVLEMVQHNLNLSFGRPPSDEAFGNKLIAKHAHIAKRNFRARGLKLLNTMDKVYKPSGVRVFTEDFEDSDDEDETQRPHRDRKDMRAEAADDGGVQQRVDDACKTISSTRRSRGGEDDARGEARLVKESNLFDYKAGGYGEVRDSTRIVWTLHGSEPGRRLYFSPLDTRQLKLQYSDAHGLPVAYIFHERLLARALRALDPALATQHCDRLLDWLGKLARSPLPASVKSYMMATLEHGAPSCVAPPLTRHGVVLGSDGEDADNDEDVNLLAIANCVAAAMPREEPVREQLTRVYAIRPGMYKFIKRKNDMYGVHVVRRQEWDVLGRYGITPVECDLGHDSLINARDDASLYLRIIGCFSEFTWLVWVRGLPTVSDQLLKWIAEYSKYHPWRFVYLEETDTSWNFGENRDRCVLTRAPMSVSRLLTCKKDLQRAQLRANRPVHEYEVDEKLVENIIKAGKDWNNLNETLKASLLPSTVGQSDGQSTQASDENQVIEFLTGGSAEQSSKRTQHGTTVGPACAGWIRDAAVENDDYREAVRSHLDKADPATVLLVSPPGAGKSHFSDELGKQLIKNRSLGFAYVDGSDDELVDTALAAVLTRKVPAEGGRMFLVIDEYHMLSSAHKKELFGWLGGQQGRLYVLLIANRKDASDDSLLEPLRAVAINARLPAKLLDEVIKKRESVRNPLAIKLWFHLSRALFGGESISLRIVDSVDEALAGPDKVTQLEELLCKKMPRLSTLTAREFVSAYLVAADELLSRRNTDAGPDADLVSKMREKVGKKAKTVIGAMIQAALLTWLDDVGRDFPDFIEGDLRGANGVSPAVKIAAWCCMMRAESKAKLELNHDIFPEVIFKTLFIDQVGFPHQLSDRASLTERKCPTFSWGGSYESLDDMTDALRRGHSINFADVYEKEWKQNEVVALNSFVVLLSACRSPATVLRSLRHENLVALLQGSLSDDALKLAKYVLHSGAFEADADKHGHSSPYRAAVWTLLMCEPDPIDVKELVEQHVPREELARALAWAPDNVASLRATRAKDRGLRQRLLTYLLVGLSKWHVARGAAAQVPLLWRGFFAPLLVPVKHPDVAEMVAKHEHDIQAGWSPLMRSVWLLAKGRAQAADLSAIKAQAPGALYLPASGGSSGHGAFRTTYATGLLISSSSVPLEDQKHLLTAPGTSVDMSALRSFGFQANLDPAELVDTKFREAIETFRQQLKNGIQIEIRIEPAEMRGAVESALRRND